MGKEKVLIVCLFFSLSGSEKPYNQLHEEIIRERSLSHYVVQNRLVAVLARIEEVEPYLHDGRCPVWLHAEFIRLKSDRNILLRALQVMERR